MAGDFETAVRRIKQSYPIFADVEVADLRQQGMSDSRKLEYYHADDSPTGKPRVEVFDSTLQGPDQIQNDKQAYAAAQAKHGETRGFDKWMNFSRLDAMVRGYAVQQWSDAYYTDYQKMLIDTMMSIVKQGNGTMMKGE